MKKETRTVNWKTGDGHRVEFVAELVLEKINYADGWNVSVPCCEINLSCNVAGHGNVGSDIRRTHNPRWIPGAVAAIGNLCVKQEQLDLIDAAIAELEAHPDWVAKQKTIEKNRREIGEMEKRRRANGYCEKCGSYCYGDCEA